MEPDAIGLDIGGANIKVSTYLGETFSVPFELWRQPDKLAPELAKIRNRVQAGRVAVTMTGELCDCFATKKEGVRHILEGVQKSFGNQVRIWSTQGKFLNLIEAREQYLEVAAANWHALATFLGSTLKLGNAVLLDVGSTTTDIIPIVGGVPAAQGFSDPTRLRSGELVYTGVRRTPICALIQEGVAAEWFATTLDAYLVLGQIEQDSMANGTADSRAETKPFAHARLARMLGGDSDSTSEAETFALAARVFERQRDLIVHSLKRIHHRLGRSFDEVMISGSGEFLAEAAWNSFAGEIGFETTTVLSFSNQFSVKASTAACAVSLAAMAMEDLRWQA